MSQQHPHPHSQQHATPTWRERWCHYWFVAADGGASSSPPSPPSWCGVSSAALMVALMEYRRGVSLAAWLLLVALLILLCVPSMLVLSPAIAPTAAAAFVTPREAADLRDEVRREGLGRDRRVEFQRISL